MGGFEPFAKPIFEDERGGKSGVPSDFAFSLLPDDWDQFMMLFEGAMERIPALESAEVPATSMRAPTPNEPGNGRSRW